MPQAQFDCVIRAGRVATAVDEFDADIGISDGVIVAIGRNLPAGTREIDAKGRLVLPGGVDAHAHIEQFSAAGIVNADTFESATVSAAFGGTTTVIPFAAQHRGMNLLDVVRDYIDERDATGYELHATVIAIADEIAGAAQLVMGKLDQVPVAVIRGLDVGGNGSALELVIPEAEDLFR